jgi:DNA-binding transcriptional MocR family regulator
MRIAVDRESAIPIHVQIARAIREQILKGAIPRGGRLPPTRRLAESLGVNRSTVVQAYQTLWSEGLVEGHVGRGTAVRPAGTGSRTPGACPPWETLFVLEREEEDREVREFVRLIDREDLISLAAGLPAPDLYPMRDLREVLDDVLAREGKSLLHWCPVEGYGPLRERLAENVPGATAGDVFLLSGSTQGISLLTRVLVAPGDFVAVQSPTYLGALQMFRSAGARIASVPVGEEGIDLDMLESVLSRTRPKILYVIPSFQNPTGVTMGLETRKGLLEIASRHAVPVLEDDPYSLLRYEGEDVPTLRELDTRGHVLYLSTFSKILVPGFRVGWLTAPSPVIERLRTAKHLTDLFTNSVGQAVVSEFIERGFLDKHLAAVRDAYRKRRDAMVRALRRHAPQLAFTVPEGGYFVWATLPPGISGRELLREALTKRVSFIHGEVFCPDGTGRDRIRINFASHPPEIAEEGARRLGSALRALRRGGRRGRPEQEVSARPIV